MGAAIPEAAEYLQLKLKRGGCDSHLGKYGRVLESYYNPPLKWLREMGYAFGFDRNLESICWRESKSIRG